jgi:hypothetical protein
LPMRRVRFLQILVFTCDFFHSKLTDMILLFSIMLNF